MTKRSEALSDTVTGLGTPARLSPEHRLGWMPGLAGRLLSSTVLIGVILGTLFVLHLWAFMVVVAIFTTTALYEFFSMARHRGILVHRPLSVTLGVLFTLLVAWRSLVEPGLVPTPIVGPGATLISWMWDIFWPATVVILFIRQIMRENTFEALSGVGTTFFGLAYIAGLFTYLFYIRATDAGQGAWLVCYLILVTKMGDAGAYAIGNWLGRHVLVARISPKKTVEGFVGAIWTSAGAAVVAQGMLGGQPIFGQPPTPALTLLLGLILGIGGQLGDLAESLLKRDCQVKDAGGLLPGLGGVLDVIDSLLFTAPLFYGILIYG